MSSRPEAAAWWSAIGSTSTSAAGPASGLCSTGLALLRRDGFASMDAGKEPGTLTTRPLGFQGGYLFVNADTEKGELRAEILDEKGEVIEPFTRARCVPIRADKTLQGVTWTKDAGEPPGLIRRLAGQPVRFRFYLTAGRLYAFWVSHAESGASHGYVAAGGPNFKGPTDTVGRA